jgi:Prealbumin-like fold domain
MILIVNFLTNSILIFLSFSLSYALETGLNSSATGSYGNNIIHYANGEELEAREIDNYPIASSNKISLTNTSDRIEGTLIVTKKVINEHGESSKPSDFTISVHGNNASPTSFPGNSSGTVVKLEMGMYSVTESGPSNYNSTSSMDCSGAVMSVETLRCDLTNTHLNNSDVEPK